MDEDRRRPKEYYQVNLDTGRIFWIAFLVGIVIIGIFIFGYYVGGEKLKNGLSSIGKSELFKKVNDTSEAVGKADEELPFLDIFEKNLEAETRYLDVDNDEKLLKEPIEEPLIIERETKKEEDIFYPTFEEEIARSPTYREKRSTYRNVGDYYIQVGSFVKKENADAFAQRLRKKMYKVVIEETILDGKQYYRVRVGPFETKSIARNTMLAMKNRYNIKDPFVLKKNS